MTIDLSRRQALMLAAAAAAATTPGLALAAEPALPTTWDLTALYPSDAAALPPVARAVGERLEVLVDGGVRSSTDVVKMLAPFEAEMRITIALTGKTSVADLDGSVLAADYRQ